MKRLVLLGAGASVEIGVPTAANMTRRFIEEARDEEVRRILAFVAGGLVNRRWQAGETPFDFDVNVEDLFSAVEMLNERDVIEAAPFIGAWQPMVDSLDRSVWSEEAQSKKWSLDNDYSLHAPFNPAPRDRVRLEDTLALVSEVFQGRGRGYHAALKAMYDMLLSFTVLRELPSGGEYLKDFVRAASATNSVIATLNYDTSLELACDATDTAFTNGVKEYPFKPRLNLEPDVLQILKLHGSGAWLSELNTWGIHDYKSLEAVVHYGYGLGLPALVFGKRRKLRGNGPFLELLEEFRRNLNDTDHVTIIGYSFGDEHINQLLLNWLLLRNNLQLTVVDTAEPAVLHERLMATVFSSPFDMRVHKESGEEYTLLDKLTRTAFAPEMQMHGSKLKANYYHGKASVFMAKVVEQNVEPLPYVKRVVPSPPATL